MPDNSKSAIPTIKLTEPQTLPPESSAQDLLNLDGPEFKKAMGIEYTKPEPEPAAKPEKPTPTPAQKANVEALAADAARQKQEGEGSEEEGDVAQDEQQVPDEQQASEEVEGEEQKAEATKEAEEAQEQKAPLTKFQVFDAEGELELPELFFNFKANRKEYEKVPLEKVVALAQMGVYNAEQHEKSTRERAEAAQRQEALESEVGQGRQIRAYAEKLLSDPLYYERARELYLSEHTPERRAARAEQELETQRARDMQGREERQIADFTFHRILPAVESLLKQHPAVSKEELIGQYTLLTAPLLVRGRIPLERLAEVESLVTNDLASWARSVHTERDLGQKRESASKASDKRKLAAAKRQVARAVAPKGAAALQEPAKKNKFTSAEDWKKTLGGLVPEPADED